MKKLNLYFKLDRMKKILIIAAHPDDEILGCGGTIAYHKNKNHKVKIIFLSDGVTSRNKFKKSEIDKRLDSAKKASLELGVKDLEFKSFPDNMFDSIPLIEIVKIIENVILKFKPNIIYTHSSCDLNIDHQITNRATFNDIVPATLKNRVNKRPYLPFSFVKHCSIRCDDSLAGVTQKITRHLWNIIFKSQTHGTVKWFSKWLNIKNCNLLATNFGHEEAVVFKPNRTHYFNLRILPFIPSDSIRLIAIPYKIVRPIHQRIHVSSGHVTFIHLHWFTVCRVEIHQNFRARMHCSICP